MISQLLPVEHLTDELPSAAPAGRAGMAAASAGTTNRADCPGSPADSARRVGHRTAVKARDITARVDAKLPAKTQPSVNPDGINPTNVSTKSPTAPSNGIVK